MGIGNAIRRDCREEQGPEVVQEFVVPALNVKAKKTLLGAITYEFQCPSCKEELATTEDLILAGETCPTCSASLVFEDALRQTVLRRRAEREAEDRQKQLERDEAAQQRRAERESAAQKQAEARKLDRALQQEREQAAAEERAEKTVRKRQKKKAVAKDAKGPTFGESLAGFLGVLLLIAGSGLEFVLGVGQVLVTFGFLMVICSALSSIRTEIIRLKLSLMDVRDEST